MIGGITGALLRTFGIIAGFALFSGAAEAQEFSAELVSTTIAGTVEGQPGKLYVSDSRVRIETPDIAGGFFLVDSDHPSAYLVKPRQHIFMESKQSSRLTQILVPVDPDDPCRQWQTMAKIAGAADEGGQWHCERISRELIGRRDTIKYLTISPQNQRSIGWVDPQLKFLIRFQAEDGNAFELKNIRQESQPASLFEIPVNYGKFDPQRLIERIKQSDVWVEPPQ